ncbi:MAG: hypothetical protein RBU30_07320 [Polyangia bacterium]|jgi:hypothetical protein|nr:hypothetical protein [Polyangia bacterium]
MERCFHIYMGIIMAIKTRCRKSFIVKFIVCLQVAVLSVGCPETNWVFPDHDAHVMPPECSDGDMHCTVNILETCIGGKFGTLTVCDEYCDPVSGCVLDLPNADSYIWIANTGEGTLSKVNTRNGREVARYLTCAYGDNRCDPSRTSVNLHGDVVVSNRGCGNCVVQIPASSVTKFAASRMDCVDRDGNGIIDTSTGPSDIKAWGEDECMLWSIELPFEAGFGDDPHGARATAWDGRDDEDTGLGGSVWVGTCDMYAQPNPVYVYKLNGDTGTVEERVQVESASCAYGGAMDNDNGFWFLCLTTETITRVDVESLEYATRPTSCGYGITVDSHGRVWTGGFDFSALEQSCIARYDPRTGEERTAIVSWDPITISTRPWLRGIAVGTALSAGFVWAAETSGKLYQIDAETLDVNLAYEMTGVHETIGVAVDFLGYVWMVDMLGDCAYCYDPVTQRRVQVRVGSFPYTYSDMTGVQLRNTVLVH